MFFAHTGKLCLCLLLNVDAKGGEGTDNFFDQDLIDCIAVPLLFDKTQDGTCKFLMLALYVKLFCKLVVDSYCIKLSVHKTGLLASMNVK